MIKFIFWTVILGTTCARNWTVLAPFMPPFLMYENNQTTGLLPELFSGPVDILGDGFLVNPVPDWLAKTAINATMFEAGSMDCIRGLRMTDSSELCLFQITPSSLEVLHTSTSAKQNPIDNLVMTAIWMELHPALLVYCKAKACDSSGLEASTIKAMYFMLPFHSSVWSLILLFTLVAGSLLFVFETTQPFQFFIRKSARRLDGCFGLRDSYLFVMLAFFLQPYKKFPKSWAGITLALFWYAFTLFCLIAYTAGSVRMIFQQVDQNESSLQSKVISQTLIVCERHHLWCNLLKNSSTNVINESQDFLLTLADPFHFGSADCIGNGTCAFLTDHVTANQLLNKQLVEDATNATWRWVNVQMECSDDSLSLLCSLPAVRAGFVTTNSLAALSMNRYDLHVSLSGKKAHLYKRWLGSPPKPICRVPGSKTENLTIRMVQMNGVLVFMITGAMLAVLAHITEYIYALFIKKDPGKERKPRNEWEALQ